MKKKFILAGLIAASALIAACSDDEISNPQAVSDTQPAVSSQENTPETQGKHIVLHGIANGDAALQKTMLASDGKSVLFTSGDQISLFDGDGNNCKLNSDVSDDGTTADFYGTIKKDAASYYILYPYQEASISSGVISAELPATQTAMPNSFDPKANLSVAICNNGEDFQLRNIGSLLKFKTVENLSKIVVRSTKGEKIAGKCLISFNSDGTPKVEPASGAVSEITLQASGNGDVAPGTYYVALFPGTLSEGLIIEFYKNGEKVTDSGVAFSYQFSFERCKGKNCGELITANGVYIDLQLVDAAGDVSNSYYIGRFEVTQELWEAVMGSNPSKFQGAKLPVENVSWYDISDGSDCFLKKLKDITGKDFRLPTSDEWILAAKDGFPDAYDFFYSGGARRADYCAWYEENSDGTTHPVGLKEPNYLYIFDMSGNVCEWCADGYGDYFYTRGGGYPFSSGDCKIKGYVLRFPEVSEPWIGFRLALSLPKKE